MANPYAEAALAREFKLEQRFKRLNNSKKTRSGYARDTIAQPQHSNTLTDAQEKEWQRRVQMTRRASRALELGARLSGRPELGGFLGDLGDIADEGLREASEAEKGE